MKVSNYLMYKCSVFLISNLQVADLGCADCTLLWMLKFYNCIEVLAGLDICASVMKEKM